MDYVGVLLGAGVFKGILTGKTGFEKLAFYEETANKLKIKPCYFRLEDIDLSTNTVNGYINIDKNNYKKVEIPIPRVIHNRGYHRSKNSRLKINKIQQQGITIFNNWNVYKKLSIYNVLKDEEELAKNLPVTKKATLKSIEQMLDEFQSIIIKPNVGSLGNGIMKVVRKNKLNYFSFYNKEKKNWKTISYTDQLPTKLIKSINSGKYLVQEFISLQTYKGSPFDLRVSCQKNDQGTWQVTGICGKVAKKNSFITNVAKGGTVYTLDELLKETVLDEKRITEIIKQVSIKIASKLEKHYTSLADVGFDIGISKEGVVKFIECNCRDLRYSFRNANMLDTWKKTYANPMGYAKFLLTCKSNNTK